VKLRRTDVNGQPGAIFLTADGAVISVIVLAIAEGQISSVSSIVNPDKLRHIGPVADMRSLLRRQG
jgi:RNA polymerase sigma-70 factor (ECF subfamily)